MDGGIVTVEQSIYSHSHVLTGGDTKFTIDPSQNPLAIINSNSNPTNLYFDHTLLGEHEFNISVNWIPNLPFAIIGVPTN